MQYLLKYNFYIYFYSNLYGNITKYTYIKYIYVKLYAETERFPKSLLLRGICNQHENVDYD